MNRKTIFGLKVLRIIRRSPSKARDYNFQTWDKIGYSNYTTLISPLFTSTTWAREKTILDVSARPGSAGIHAAFELGEIMDYLDRRYLFTNKSPLSALVVVKGWGKIVVGEKGFICDHARIAAILGVNRGAYPKDEIASVSYGVKKFRNEKIQISNGNEGWTIVEGSIEESKSYSINITVGKQLASNFDIDFIYPEEGINEVKAVAARYLV